MTQSTTQSLEEQTAQSGEPPTRNPCLPGPSCSFCPVPPPHPGPLPGSLAGFYLPTPPVALLSHLHLSFRQGQPGQTTFCLPCVSSLGRLLSAVLCSLPSPQNSFPGHCHEWQEAPECKPSSYAGDHLSIGHLGGQQGQAHYCLLLPVEKGYSPSPPGKAKTGHLFCSPRSRPLILWSQARWPVTYRCLQIFKVIFSLDIIHCLLEFKGYIQIIYNICV